jgi:hypothetical protein
VTFGRSFACWRVFPRRDDGIAATEFGLIAPVFFLLILGMFDIAHMAYARSVLRGAVEVAARQASLETGDTEEADAIVKKMVEPILPGVEIDADRTSYFDFADIDRPEQFDDGNGNDICDEGESYVDENRSGAWDADIGVDGNGGSGDVVLYRVSATYSPLFPVPFMPSAWTERTIGATAVKKNQPFSNQVEYATTSGTCTE